MISKYIVVLALVVGSMARIPTPIRPIPGSVIPTPPPRPSVQPPVLEILPTPELGCVNQVVPEIRPEIIIPEIGVFPAPGGIRPELRPEIGVHPEVILPEIGVRPEVVPELRPIVPELEVSPEVIERPQIKPEILPGVVLPGGVMPSLPSAGCEVVPEVLPPVVAPVRPELRPANPTIIR